MVGDEKREVMKRDVLWSWLPAIGVIVLCVPLLAQDNSSPQPTIRQAVAFGVSPPLRELVKLPQPLRYGFHDSEPQRRIPVHKFGAVVDPVEQSTAGAAPSYSLGLSVLGLGNGFPNYDSGVSPPDTNMAVGDTQIVQWVNTYYAVFDKATGAPLTDALDGNTPWYGWDSDCGVTNAGDPIVQWDVVAHRWLLTQNTYYLNPNYACVAVSTTSDAMGSYYLYKFALTSDFAHYPHWGVWPTGYFATMLIPDSDWHAKVCAFNRSKILVGDGTAEEICFELLNDGLNSNLLPADVDSPTPPPAGEDEFFIGGVNAVDNSHLSLYSMHINNQNDWSQGATFTGTGNSQLIAVAPYNSACPYPDACVPQLGTNDMLDDQGGLVMYRFAYWADPPAAHVGPHTPPAGSAQHWFVNQTVVAAGGNDAVRWYEFTAPIRKVPVTALAVFQQGTFAPDSKWRWMASMARDKVGDILVGYSVSSASTYPAIAIAGRTVNDPPGTLESEVTVVHGTGSQLESSNRWGDYSSMRIDQDGCTFWYTQEYYMLTMSNDWSTRIASAKFPNCR